MLKCINIQCIVDAALSPESASSSASSTVRVGLMMAMT
jgi:hypothetical protein